MYTIKRAAELTGVPAATLRAWERRYDVVEPGRTDAGYRLYDEDAIGRIRDMAALLSDGWSASTAAAEVSRRHLTSVAPDLHEPTVATTAARTPSPTPPDDLTTWTQQLIAAAALMDPTAVARVLDERFALASFESTVDDWLLPALAEVGRAWATGQISVAGEHLVAHAVLRRLAAAYDAAASRTAGATVIVGLPAGVHHELGIFAFAVALRRLGLNTVYLGPDLPSAAWASTLDTHSAGCAVLSVPGRRDVRAARDLVTHLRTSHADAAIFVGGARQDDLDDEGAVRLGHAIGPGAAQVAAALA